MENISSFLGIGRISYVLEQIGIDDTDTVARIINTLSHKTVFRYEMKEMVPDNVELLTDIFNKIQQKYNRASGKAFALYPVPDFSPA